MYIYIYITYNQAYPSYPIVCIYIYGHFSKIRVLVLGYPSPTQIVGLPYHRDIYMCVKSVCIYIYK